ncbi:ExbD/TolR family protein [Sulfuriferula nivalis]|uniref:Biopolymer transporter ExbD n=1 Tax=Sulfuriferula nivalis TaxID=2675298 RepID=A0A809RHB7_9PROT|nr:biopolymer transporter ExbD [Sulfuriferula nivalis]BBP01279.1 biopolymer transporter ExbD [Sulfuriferula nivalis]
MNFQRRQNQEEPEINLIPMIDVLLVVLIFLMVTTTYAKFSELQINLPQANGETSKEKPAQITVSVDAVGNYQVNANTINFTNVTNLAQILKQEAKGSADTVIIINADAKATHQSVVNVMEAGREAGLTRITFATQKSN